MLFLLDAEKEPSFFMEENMMLNPWSCFFKLPSAALFLGLLNGASAAFAGDYLNDNCHQDVQIFENTQLQIDRFSGTSVCYVSIHSDTDFSMKYRNYLLTNNGLLMIFNSFGNGPEATTTGAREYYFPTKLKTIPRVSYKNQIITVVLTDNVSIQFSTQTGDPIQISNASFTLDPKIVTTNKGGLEIKNSTVIYVDGGFRMGKAPTSVDSGKSDIKQQTQSCTVQNSELFDNSAGLAVLKFKNGYFESFVKQRCANM